VSITKLSAFESGVTSVLEPTFNDPATVAAAETLTFAKFVCPATVTMPART
jgi:hypothetical protein